MTSAVNVLMYHAISDAPGPTSIDPATFRGQMDRLAARGYRVASLRDFAAWHGGEIELPTCTAIITFDDGFADFTKQAAPILLARGWSATIKPLAAARSGRELQWAAPRRVAEQNVVHLARPCTRRARGLARRLQYRAAAQCNRHPSTAEPDRRK